MERVEGFDVGMQSQEDYDLALRLATRSRICASPDALTLVREHAGRTTSLSRVEDLYENKAVALRKAAAAQGGVSAMPDLAL